jgi:hypothetical protein
MGLLDLMSVGRRRVRAVTWRYFSAVRRQLHHTRPADDPYVLSSPPHAPRDTCPTPSNGTVFEDYLVLNIERPERKILVTVVYQ